MSFRPHIKRTTRIINAIHAKSRQLFLEHPECVFASLSFGVVGSSAAFYKMYKYGLWEGVQPYYRNYYHVVRPDSTVALNWRVPEDYPASYLSNRENQQSSTFKQDYGYNCKL